MGTRGAFGVIINEKEKISYNHFDSYPDGKGVEVLGWLRNVVADGNLEVVRKLAEEARVVSDDTPPTAEDKERLKRFTNLNVSEQSDDDWYCLMREAQGDLQLTLESGYIYDGSNFPLDSLFCEWGYVVDLDNEVLEVYKGFQHSLPQKGRWAGRPTAEEDAENYRRHLEWAKKNGREPWHPEESEYKAVEMIASYPFSDLPTDTQFVAELDPEEEE